ncbi:MAG: hypothetical protein QM820_02715 [Minicystis sp.]
MSILRSALAYGTLLCAFSLPACGGGGVTGTGGGSSSATGTGGGDPGTGGAGTGGGFMTAEHTALPKVITFGGPVLKTPKVQAIVYASDPKADDIDAFLAELAATSYWGEATAEYGVGALQILPTIKRPESPPAKLTDTQLSQDLAAQTSGASPAWGAADPSTIYLFVLPQGTVIDAGGECCTDYDGYHDEATVGAIKVPYGIVCSCPGLDGPGVNDVQQVTVAMSHELVEAATDPLPFSDPAYAQTDDPNVIWTLITGGETADMCEFDADSFVIPKGSKYMVQKSWSNAAAAAGKEPCIPATEGAPFFGVSPVLPDQLSITGVPFLTSGVKIPVGQSKTIDLQLFSNAPTQGPWKVTAYDLNAFFGGSPNLELTLDKATGQNGDVLALTIKVLSLNTDYGVDAFILESDLGGESSLSVAAVGTK